MDGMNHVLQRATMGAVSEYAKLPKALDPRISPTIATWVKTLKRR